MAVRRCSTCREFFDKDDIWRGADDIQAFCSEECFKKKSTGLNRVPKEGVSEELRAQIKRRDLNSCRMCGTFGRFPGIHHVIYRSEGGGHTSNNLILLCQKCHDRAHSNKELYQPVLLKLVKMLENGSKPRPSDFEHMVAVEKVRISGSEYPVL